MPTNKPFWIIPKDSMSLEEALVQAGFHLTSLKRGHYFNYRQIYASNKIEILGEINYKLKRSHPHENIRILSEEIETPDGSYLRDFLDIAKEKYRKI